jgi:hypothetical protein
MSIQQKSAFSFLSACITAGVFIFLASIAAQGQTVSLSPSSDEAAEESSVQGITFPVPELGNCASKNECREYCNQAEHMDACIAFAKDHGLMTAKDATRAGKFGKLVRAGNSPGQCDSPRSCAAYCGNLSHLDECTTFAEKNGFKDEHYEQGKKIQAFLKNGGTTPGNCQTKEECQKYCGDFNHAKECFSFAQKAGIMQKGESSSHEPNADQLGKIAELAEKGETPGQCISKDECEKYCQDANHREECVDFGVKIGFIEPSEAAKIKQMGGKGPGDCNSEESCRAYCNDRSHHEECFKFAEEHGFMTHDESEKAKEGWVRARQGFENAPREARECLKTTLGGDILTDIQSGKLVPGPDIADRVRGCFEKFGGHGRPEEAMKNIPPEVAACLKEKFGDDFEKIRTGKAPMTPEMADSFRACFQMFHEGGTGFKNKDGGQIDHEGFRGRSEEGNGRTPQAMMPDMLRSAPPEVAACIKEKFPEGLPSAVKDTQAGMEIKEKIQSCFENLHRTRPEGTTGAEGQGFNGTPEQMPPKPEFEGNAHPVFTGGLANMPPEVLACIRGAIGEEGFAKLQTAPPSLELIGIIRTCMEKMSGSVPPSSPQIEQNAVPQPITFLEKFIGAALMPVRWILGK